MIPVAILCGGKGTRLGDLARDTPKSLVRVAGYPFLHHQLTLLNRKGVERVVLCIGHLGGQIVDYAGDGSRWGLHIDYSDEGDLALGTAGAIRQALPLLGDKFLTLYGDSYLDAVDYREVAAWLDFSSAVRTIWKDGTDYGLNGFRASAVPVSGYNVTDIIDSIWRLNRGVTTVNATERYHEIGSLEGLAETEAYIRCAFTRDYLRIVAELAGKIDIPAIESMVDELVVLRYCGGRLFILGNGGGAANASHAVCDFRNLCGIEAHCPADNAAHLTALENDRGWHAAYREWLSGFLLSAKDTILVFSVGGGDLKNNVSANIVNALEFAKDRTRILAIVGRDGGDTARYADHCLIVPTVDASLVTPLTESFQAVAWHLLVSHPRLKLNRTKWEEVDAADH